MSFGVVRGAFHAAVTLFELITAIIALISLGIFIGGYLERYRDKERQFKEALRLM
jgi:hypothetical protein